MIQPRLAIPQQLPNGDGRNFRTNGRAKFINEKVEGLSLLPAFMDLLVKPAVSGGGYSAVEGGAHDNMARIGEYGLLSSDFGFGVDTQRVYRICFRVVPSLAIEHEISREKHERTIRRELGQVSRGVNIDLPGLIRICLTLRAAAHRRAVDD